MFHQVMINKNILLPIGCYSKLFVDMGASASLRTITCSFSYTPAIPPPKTDFVAYTQDDDHSMPKSCTENKFPHHSIPNRFD